MKIILSVLLLVAAAFSQIAEADSCSAAISTAAPEPLVGKWCNQTWVNFFWNAYDFDEGDWDNGFGFSNACDTRRPLGRTLNAIYLLNYADGPSPKSTDDFSGSFLHWAGNYTMREIDELDGRCYKKPSRSGVETFAWTQYGLQDNWTQLYIPFFYDEDVVQRAATLVHESRHMDWCAHNGNDGNNPCPLKGTSCDESFDNGCGGFGSPTGPGADAYEVLWLWWFTVGADSGMGTTTRKASARDTANFILNMKFDVSPCFNITSSGKRISICSN